MITETVGLDAEGRGSCNSPSGGTQTSCVNIHDDAAPQRRAAGTAGPIRSARGL